MDDESEPPQDDEGHDGQIDDPVPLVADQVVREEGVTAVVEGGDGVVKGVIEGDAGGKFL